MDALDIRIIRSMGIRPYERTPKHPDALKPSRIAQEVGTSVVTVKERIGRLEDAGVIGGYQLYPNFGHLGLTAQAYFFRVSQEARKKQAVEAASRLEGLLELHDFVGAGICADLAFRDEKELDARLTLLSEYTGDPSPQRFYDRQMPPVKRPLTNLDWRILQALRGRAKRPLAEVAEAVGASGRTVRRRYDAMAAQGSFFVVPLLDPGKAEGLILFELVFYLEPKAKASVVNEVLRRFDERHVYTYRPASPALGNFDMLLFAKSLGDVETLRQSGEKVPGVDRVEAWLFQGFFDHSSWIDGAMAEQVQRDASRMTQAAVEEPPPSPRRDFAIRSS